jgi:prepilin-type N-terminal cleavage/methylation domain-containing protein
MNRNTLRKGFTLIELMAVVVILAILAGVALPKFFNYAADAKKAACKGALGGVRAGIANFYADKAINSATSRYPTLAELTGTSVMLEIIPENPYVSPSSNVVVTATFANSTARTVGGVQGWRYFSGGGAGSRAIFWANTDSAGVSENDF